ncbi:adenylyltransferase/cytidyltransferase family protein [Candidatus Saccharibacteria bacterium]|nr:adenylyltransferase/cytidyltransferase family protein [Candidatus Saccharibacteria bacterium]MBQ6605760.1 adenylyltransferase/cytidyltransferase family protein [Candidatus Saccharibacteria bacterium]
MKERIVITYGTFDILHYGHIRLLERARALGDRLYVGISTDEFCKREKNKKCFYPYSIRQEMVRALRCVDKVFPEENFEQKFDDFRKYHPDIFVLGSDYRGSDKLNGIEKFCQIVILERTPNISTTKIKQALKIQS